MTEEIYTIKDAAKQINVETHVLRYWEEELGLTIERNEMGHRCYTKEDVALLQNIKIWKDQGLQLKAIRIMLSENGKFAVPQQVVREAQAMVTATGHGGEAISVAQENMPGPSQEHISQPDMPAVKNKTVHILMDERESRAARLQYLLQQLVSQAVQENNAAILKELDYQFRQMEENAQVREERRFAREEEHYRKLDELICQKSRKKEKKKTGAQSLPVFWTRKKHPEI